MKTLLKKLLPASVADWLRRSRANIDNGLYPFFAHHGWLSSLYYTLFSSQFRREHKAVLQGRLHYRHSLNQIRQSSILLRRNTHRLEKGLIMQPRRPVFAEDYIAETVACYQKCLASEELCRDELKWASDVLHSYFDVCQDTPVIAEAREKFTRLTHKIDDSQAASLPYAVTERPLADITPDQLLTLFRQRRSIRWFEPQAVNPELIRQAVDMASLAPSACNRQPFEFQLTTNPERATKLAKIAIGTAGFADNIPALIAVVGDLSAYPAERDRHVIYIDAALAAMQLMLALETLGLSSCPLNWPDIESCERRLAEQLALPYHQRPVMLIAVGHAKADGYIPYSQKKNHRLLLKEID